MSSQPISATVANLRRRYNSQVYAQIQVHFLFLSLSYSGGTTRDTTGESSGCSRRRNDGFTCSPRHGGVTPPTSQLRAVTEAYYAERLNN
ncbi:unnamed protein product, partial [Brenthis ino]